MTDLTATGTINFAGATVSNGGTVTTVAINGGTISGITDLAIADGGTAASNASDARDNLGLTIGTNIQAYDAGLQSIAGLTTAADKMIYTTALDTYAVTDLSAAGRALIDDASAGDQRTTLGLGTMATQNANSVAITGGTISGITNISDTGNTLPFSFSTTITDSDPGSGVFRLDNATQNTATNIYIDDEDSNAVDVSAFIQTLSGGNNPSSILGLVTLRKEFSPEVFLQFKVTGVINAAGYTKLAVTNLSSSTANPFSNSDNVLIDISLSGDKGDAGDITGPVSSTDNAIARWDGTAGNLIQDSSVLIADDGTITAAQYDSTESLPDIKPSLNLDFANVKTLDPRITYTRASTGTYYDGKTFAKAEENLLLQSQDFTTSWLLSNATITANSTTAPDGSSTADTLTGNGASGQHLVQQQITVISGLNYVFSFFAKANTNDFVQLRFGGGFGSPTANFDLSAGTVGTTTGTITATIQDAGSGWYRCSGITDATITGLTAVQMYLVTSASAAAAETNTLSTSIYLWGAQLEQRDSLTDYTPTTTQPITNYIPALQTAASGVARFDHDPITSESLGFLIEEQRTNLMTYSQELDNGAWSVNSNATILANAVVAPDGTVTADLLRENGINGEHYHGQSLTYATGTDYTISAYVRPAGRHQCQLFFPASAFSSQVTTIFDLSAGTVGTSNADNAGIETLPGGWFRIWQTHRATASTSGNTFLRLINAGSTSYQGDGYSGVYIWGAQLEAGAFPTSYIKTTGAQATRNADAASMTGTNFSEWYRQDAGTIFEISRAGSPTGNAFAVQMSDNSYSNRVIIGQDSANAVGQVLVSSSVTLSVTASGRTTDALALVFAATTNDGQIAKDGALGSSDTSGAMPTALTRLDVGADHTGANGLNGTISRLTYYPKRLSNATLQALTEE